MGGADGYLSGVEKPFHSSKRLGDFLKRRDIIAWQIQWQVREGIMKRSRYTLEQRT